MPRNQSDVFILINKNINQHFFGYQFVQSLEILIILMDILEARDCTIP